jgi:hypothetical protein
VLNIDNLRNVPFVGGQSTVGGGSTSDKSKEWQMELLMEKLRSKASTFKPLVETAKNMRMAMLVSDLCLFLSLKIDKISI